MTTITIPRADYVQRADDEGHDFYPFRTVSAAAKVWEKMEKGRTFDYIGATDDAGAVVFVTTDSEGDVHLDSILIDPEMELYPADALPFAVAAQKFDVGDWIAPQTAPADRTPFRVVTVNERGTWLSHRAPWNTEDGLLKSPDYDEWKVVPAPTKTYSVTVAADYTATDVLNAVRTIVRGNVTVLDRA